MTRAPPRFFAIATLLPLAALFSLTAFGGCSTDGACDCTSPVVTITIPADIASAITTTNIRLTGPGCVNAALDCANETNGCTAYDFTPVGAGDCDIEVDTPTGTFTDSLPIAAQTGCCAGFYSTTSSTVNVPDSDAG